MNALSQFVNHVAGTNLGALNFIGASKNDSIGTAGGAILGTAIDLAAVSIASRGAADLSGAP